MSMSQEELRHLAKVVHEHLSPADASIVGRVCSDPIASIRFVNLMSAHSGETVTHDEWAALVLRVAKRALDVGGAS